MCTPEVEKEIEKLDPEISKIYFDAKHEMLNANDSRSERFTAAARIVRAFWKRISANQCHGK
jgi:mRNA-degrading endonuclease RelE of RelBE toxin-antitoxin system